MSLTKIVKKCSMKYLGSLLFWLTILLINTQHSSAQTFTATALGDYGNVTVMEVSGTYDAKNPDGTFNTAPREAIAKEFYSLHKDEYDFLVIFSNFNFSMPSAEAKAFYTGVKNDIQGIGLETFDGSSYYGSNGKLQGTIDMGNISGYVTNPLDPQFEETLRLLSHEMMHRWGVRVKFKNADGTLNSALLGKDSSHWSFLVDSQGSLMYGNTWQNNGDGTFTSTASLSDLRYYSPLDLYFMGIYGKSQVPPILLIENATYNGSPVDRTQTPLAGVTITGTARYVTIDEIIAAEGERIPGVATSQKTFKTAFIFITTPGTFKADDVYAIENVRNGAVTRFSVQTDGRGIMEVASTLKDGIPVNPGVILPPVTPRTLPPDINEGATWLINHQRSDGHWEDLSLTAQRDTTETLITLKNFSSAQQNYLNGVTWLASSSIGNTDYLSRTIQTLAGAGQNVSSLSSELVSRQNTDGGWGSRAYYMSNPADTALALLALTAAGYNDPAVIAKTIVYLTASQNPDGGWSPALDQGSSIQPSSVVLSALNAYRSTYQLENTINSGISWLTQKQNSDGGFGNSPSTVYDTAVAVLALRELAASTVITNNGLSYLKSQQTGTGSWNESAYQTALAVHALWKAQVDPDLSIVSSDITFIPATITSIPATIAINANIWNLGKTGVSQATVALFDGDPALGNKLSEQVVAVPGQSATIVTFSVTISDRNEHIFFVSVDPGNQINESNETNNIAWKTIVADIPAPKVTITSPVSGTISTPAPQLLYTVTPDTATVTVKVDGVVVNKVSGNYLDPLSSASHTVRVEATDGFSTGFAEVTFTVDFSPPVVTIPSPVNGVYSENNPLLLYQVSKTASVTVKVDGLVVNTVSGNRLSALADGAHTVRVEATDAGGAAGYREVSFVVYSGTQTPYELTGVSYLGSRTVEGTTADSQGNSYTVSYDCTVDTMWVTKYDQTGKVVWESPLSSTTSKQCLIPTSIAVDDEGSAYVALWTLGGLGDYQPVGFQDPYLVKFSNDGTLGWVRRPTATTASDYAYSVSIGRDGYIYVGGIDGYVDAYWAKYDKTGVKKGGKTVELGTYNFPTICDVTADADGNVYVSGYTDGSIYYDPSKYPNAGSYDYYVVSFNINGSQRWAYQGGTSGSDKVTGIGADAFGGVYVSGTTDGGLEGNTSQGWQDAFVAKFSSSGVRQWTQQLGTASSDAGNAIEVEKNGVLYIAGTTSGTFAGADGTGGVFVVKGDGSGSQFNQHWVKQFGTATWISEGISLGVPGLLFVREGNTLYKLRDPRLPEVALNQTFLWSTSASMTLNGTIEAGAEISTVSVDSGASASPAAYPTSTTWQVNLTNLAEGENHVTVTATNSAGFVDTAYGTIKVDTVIPIVTISSPLNWQTYYDKPVLEYTVSEGSVKVKINGVEAFRQSGYTLDSLSSGENTIRIEATDEAGNVGFAEITIIADGAAVGELPYVIASQQKVGSTSDDTVTDSIRDGSGNIYVTGYTAFALDGNTSYGGTDIFVIKYDSAGNKIGKAWQIGTTSNESNSRIAVDPSGNVYLAWQVTYASPKNGNYSDIQVAKYDATGMQAWIKAFGSKTYDYLGDIAVDSAGNVYIGGFTLGAIGTGTYGGSYDYFLTQFSSAGRQKWTVESGLSSSEEINAIALDQAGNLYVTGQIGNNPFVHKYSSSGAAQWANPVIIDSQHGGYGNAVAIDGSGNAVIAGTVDLGTGSFTDLFIAKYSPSGSALIPLQTLGSGSYDYARAVTIDAAGNIFAVGNAEAEFDGNRFVGSSDIFVAKFTAGGQKTWSQQLGSVAADYAAAVIADNNGGLFITGYTYGDLGGAVTGGADAFLIKLQK